MRRAGQGTATKPLWSCNSRKGHLGEKKELKGGACADNMSPSTYEWCRSRGQPRVEKK